MLNEIYGRFDCLSRNNDCLRIKTLGDCYCCVSGMPVSRPYHAQNVVRTGLQMVQAIKSVRDMTASSLDMRIGVHSGNVLCGVLGTAKWKYDIWSDDVSYANFLESTGVPGRIHISKATMLQLGDVFAMDLVKPPVINSMGEPQETYLIRHMNPVTYTLKERRTSFQTNRSINSRSTPQQLSTYLQTWGAPKPFQNLAIVKVQDDKVPVRSYEMLEASVISTFLSQTFCHMCCQPQNASQHNCISLLPVGKHNRCVIDKAYKTLQSDSVAKLSTSCLLYFIFSAIANCVLIKWHYPAYVITGFGLSFIIFIIYFHITTNKKQGCGKRGNITVGYYFLLVTTMLIQVSYNISLHVQPDRLFTEPTFERRNETEEDSLHLELKPVVYSLLLNMTMLASVFLFVFTNYLMKCLISFMSMTIVICMIFATDYRRSASLMADHDIADLYGIPWIFIYIFMLIGVTAVMGLTARQGEYGIKSLIIWKRQYTVENVEVETMKDLTKLLLTNILPQHVASYYLNCTEDRDLYHESYDNVCIMFASVVNFEEFFKLSSGTEDRQHQCLRLLNEIIGDIDQLLLESKFSNIEKMKTVGSTYMAAAGLQPGRARDKGASKSDRSAEEFVQIMTDFALEIFHIIDNINKHSFNNFRLRIGLSHGPVIAGVVGAQKPQYDVWGNTVNMASRMESGGVIDAIQMTEETGQVLMSLGYPVVCRGKTVVKGKSELVTTYLLEPDKQALSSIPERERSSISSYLSEYVD